MRGWCGTLRLRMTRASLLLCVKFRSVFLLYIECGPIQRSSRQGQSVKIFPTCKAAQTGDTAPAACQQRSSGARGPTRLKSRTPSTKSIRNHQRNQAEIYGSTRSDISVRTLEVRRFVILSLPKSRIPLASKVRRF